MAPPPRNNILYTLTLTVRDVQQPWVTITRNSTYRCPLPPPTIGCSGLLGAVTFEPGELSSPSLTIQHTGPLFSPDAVVTVVFSVDGLPTTKTSMGTIARGVTGTFGIGVAPPGFSAVPPGGLPLPAIGAFTVRAVVSFTSSVGGGTCPPVSGSDNRTVTGGVVVRPYFKVIGGDIITYNSGAPIYGWNQLALPPYATATPPVCVAPLENGGQCGAGSQAMVVSAGNNIDGVSSSFRTPGPLAPRTLTMANTSGQWGGAFGDRAIPSFPAIGGLTTIVAIPAGISGGNTVYNMTGNQISSTNLSDGARITVYHTGTVWIRGNIAYADSGSFSSITDISRFRLVATGNIYIDPAVTRLDGEYISSGGSIYTCHNSTWSAATIGPALYGSACRTNNLVVNGSLIGSNIKLTRSGGTLVSATPADGVPVGASYVNAGNIAEVVQFTPELFFAKPAGTANIPAGTVYDSITALPPLF